ncbi:RNA-binding protein [Candidatus Curtissbacteria bacterium RIFCSPLOWO2_02_FULL_40_11]|uniref:RNA-binding protein n=1 Tax=Candidatus Curtissbacteria bacterium RIFCSPHIGHO2_02_FULL_40_16b TaxID=1797714 RepID=A0A1F5G921_9BACT|nr:MAG: RNA-binding protein [Candidatus Curtissbacteria bacterium RIFCSPHIGHO2_02_FULL_40_16b]OGE00237.1 MAG: RNA-binding protein [Candidatus Curtissbacteria bacterium RIFCSPLOWO2_02_FULL_40_11]
MAAKLFVGNIPYTINSDGLRDIFVKIGEVVDANVVTDRETGRSRGFGFVEMKTSEDAKKAIDTLNGSEVDGRKIFVSEAREKAPRDNQPQ